MYNYVRIGIHELGYYICMMPKITLEFNDFMIQLQSRNKMLAYKTSAASNEYFHKGISV
jgi:hypothetical protein